MVTQVATTVPNASMPIADAQGIPTPSWFRVLMQVIKAQPVQSSLMMYQGTDAPQGWTKNTTVGLPSLPTGFIWIQKN